MNTGLAVMEGNLASWSWRDIIAVYRALGKQLQKHYEYSVRCNIPKTIDINYSDENNMFIIRFHQDVDKVNFQVEALDAEILRRNRLVGVMG